MYDYNVSMHSWQCLELLWFSDTLQIHVIKIRDYENAVCEIRRQNRKVNVIYCHILAMCRSYVLMNWEIYFLCMQNLWHGMWLRSILCFGEQGILIINMYMKVIKDLPLLPNENWIASPVRCRIFRYIRVQLTQAIVRCSKSSCNSKGKGLWVQRNWIHNVYYFYILVSVRNITAAVLHSY